MSTISCDHVTITITNTSQSSYKIWLRGKLRTRVARHNGLASAAAAAKLLSPSACNGTARSALKDENGSCLRHSLAGRAFIHQESSQFAIGIYLRACIYTHACLYMRSEDAAFFSSLLAASASAAGGQAARASNAGAHCAEPGTAACACCSRVYERARHPMARGAETYTHITHTFPFVACTGKLAHRMAATPLYQALPTMAWSPNHQLV